MTLVDAMKAIGFSDSDAKTMTPYYMRCHRRLEKLKKKRREAEEREDDDGGLQVETNNSMTTPPTDTVKTDGNTSSLVSPLTQDDPHNSVIPGSDYPLEYLPMYDRRTLPPILLAKGA